MIQVPKKEKVRKLKIRTGPRVRLLLIIALLAITPALFTGFISNSRTTSGQATLTSQSGISPSPWALMPSAGGPKTGMASLLATVDLSALPRPIVSDNPLIVPGHGSKNPSAAAPSAISNLGATPQTIPSSPVPPQPDVSSVGFVSSASLAITASFQGLNQLQSCSCTPPDPSMAAGPNHVVQMVNFAVEVFFKDGTSAKLVGLNSFFNRPSGDFVFDPKVLFDAASGRFFATAADGTTDNVTIAVSTSNDPTSTWKIYAVSAGTFFPDQPLIGVSDDKFVVSVNAFGSFTGAEYWVLNKSEMTAGAAKIDLVAFGPNSSLFSVHPAHSLSSITTEFMVTVGANSTAYPCQDCNPQFFNITGVPPGTVTVTTSSLSSLLPILAPPGGVQPGTTILIDTTRPGSRLLDAAWFQGKLWFSFDDGCIPSGDTTQRTCFRLVQVATATPSIIQNFDVGAASTSYFYPAVSIDGTGNLAIIFGFSSSTVFPSLAFTEQATSDPAGTLEQPLTLKSGNSTNTSGRYGDYFAAGVDPANPVTVWGDGEYGSTKGGAWTTFIGAVTRLAPDFTIAANPDSLTLTQGTTGTSNITLASINNFKGKVSLSAKSSSGLVRSSLSPTSVTLTAGGTGISILTISVKSTAFPGNYFVNVTGVSGSLSHSAFVFVCVPSQLFPCPQIVGPSPAGSIATGVSATPGAPTLGAAMPLRASTPTTMAGAELLVSTNSITKWS